MRNAELIRKVADKIAAEPELYYQANWAEYSEEICGTKCCIAGHALLESGEYYIEPVLENGRYYADFKRNTNEVLEFMRAVWPEVDGAKALGLTEAEADMLFDSYWEPKGEGPIEERVQKALYALADGASIEDITA